MIDKDTTTDEVPDDIELLLPWYQAGTLAVEDQRRVETFLADHPDLNVQKSLIDEEMDLVRSTNEMLPMPGREGLANLMTQVESETPTGKVKSAEEGAEEGIVARCLGLIFPAPVTALRAGLAACLLLIAVQVGALFYVSQDQNDGFTTASGPQDVMSGTPDVLVAFQANASIDDVGALLASIDATIVDGPKAGGIFGLRLSGGAEDEAALATLQAATDLIRFAAPAGQ